MINASASSYLINLNLIHEISFRNALRYDYVRKFGTNPSVGIGANQDIWDQGGAYVFPSDSGEEMFIASSDTNDTEGGSGAEIVDVVGLDQHGITKRSFVLMNGQTEVSIGVFSRVFRARVVGEQPNVGDLYVGNGTFTTGVPENIFAKIVINASQTRMAIFTVPSDMMGSLVHWSGSVKGVGSKSVELALIYREPNGTFIEHDYFPLAQNTNTFLHRNLIPGEYLPPFTDVLVRADSDSVNLIVRAKFVILLKNLIDIKEPPIKGF